MYKSSTSDKCIELTSEFLSTQNKTLLNVHRVCIIRERASEREGSLAPRERFDLPES